MSEVRKMSERWWITVCPECNGLAWPATNIQTHNETCPNRYGGVFVPRNVEVVPAREVHKLQEVLLAERILEVQKRISLINTDIDRPSARKDWVDLLWACDELRDIAGILKDRPKTLQIRLQYEEVNGNHQTRRIDVVGSSFEEALQDLQHELKEKHEA